MIPFFGSKRMDPDITIVDPMWVMNRVSDRIRNAVGVHELVASLFLELLLVAGAQDGKLILPGDIRKSNFEFPPAYIDLVRDALADQETHRRDFGVSRRVVAMPLVMRHRCHAVLLLVWEGNAFVEEQRRELLSMCLPVVTLALSECDLRMALGERDSVISELKVKNAAAVRRAGTDGLTGLINKGHFDEIIGLEVARSRRYDNSLSVVLTDIDFFKKINDTYGHQTGDLVLRRVAQVLKMAVRDCDFVARYGGEEFIVLLPQTDMQGAHVVAERIRQAVQQLTFELEGDVPALHVTMSFGIGLMRSQDSVPALIERADQALYLAKRSGRNQVRFETEVGAAEAEEAHRAREEKAKRAATEQQQQQQQQQPSH